MGSGSSAKKATVPLDEDDELPGPQKSSAKYRVPLAKAAAAGSTSREDDDSRAEDDGQGNFRPCDKCGETRKTARFGGLEAQWLCAACQLDSGAMRPRPPRRMQAGGGDAPALRLEETDQRSGLAPAAARRVRESRRSADRNPAKGFDDSNSSAGEVTQTTKRSRRAGKERVMTQAADASAAAKPRPNIVNMNVVEQRQDYRSLKGLTDLKEQMGFARHTSHSSDHDKEEEADAAAAKVSLPPPLCAKTELPGGYYFGDRVNSLISRVRNGLMVLELGHEGTVVGARQAKNEEVRILVQFDRSFDWLLAPTQVCLTNALSSAKAAGLPRFNWGARVRSLVTFMKPMGANKELWLGDAGTVVGPGQSLGKLAVRFDDGGGEWSVWPTVLCEANQYSTLVKEKLAGSYTRGQRVKALKRISGNRSAITAGAPPEARGPHALAVGEEGTVVGPGHISGRLLVHFDSDQRVWSLPLESLAAVS